MSLSPIIVIGCGGSGGKVVLSLRRRLGEGLQRLGWNGGIPKAFQMVWVDLPEVQESHETFGEPLPGENYVQLSLDDRYANIDELVMRKAGQQAVRLIGWRPSPHIELPVKRGAGQMRAIGRCVAISNTDEVKRVVERAVDDAARGAAELAALCEHLGFQGKPGKAPFVFVVSSLAGGTGAGVFLDVCDLVRYQCPGSNQRIVSVLLTAEVFPGIAGEGIPANSLAASSELMNAMLAVDRELETLYRGGATKESQSGGPSVSYLVGMETLDEGLALESPDDVYRTISESLTAFMLDKNLQDQIVNHDLTNRNAEQGARQSKFEMLAEEPGLNTGQKSGFVSSFGSAKVSVGSGRFGEWARDRMVRSVLAYLLEGWRNRALELVDPDRRGVARDSELVRCVVEQDRTTFFEECGLWEEDEPRGTPHDQVIDGIMVLDDLRERVKKFEKELIGGMRQWGNTEQGMWVKRLPEQIGKKRGDFRAEVVAALAKGADEYSRGVVGRLESAVSKWLAQYGLPVAAGLVEDLGEQCKTACEQLRNESREYLSTSNQDNTSSAILGEFKDLRRGEKVDADSKFVKDAVHQGLGPDWKWAKAQRCDVAVSLLEDVVDRVLGPFIRELADQGRKLEEYERSSEVRNWPAGGGVPDLYAPAVSEFCLVEAGEWDRMYEHLLTESTESTASPGSAGSVERAREIIGAGGFEHGREGARDTAVTALAVAGGDRWSGRSGRPVRVALALSPAELKDRTSKFLSDPDHPMGRFVAAGLQEYLAKDSKIAGASHGERIRRFRECLTLAMSMASPLFKIDQTTMSRLHNKIKLDTRLTIQQLPFDTKDPAYEAAKEIITGEDDVREQDFKSVQRPGVESVLIVRRLAKPVHPAVVASLYEPIVNQWTQATNLPRPAQAIKTFWDNRRARLLQEFVPLPRGAIESIVRGWFVGRLLGLITDPTPPSSGPRVHFKNDHLRDEVAEFPWPLLHHSRTEDLHDRKDEWLPALLEHLPMAMMMLSQNEHALDAYEQTYQLGRQATSHLKRFIVEGPEPSDPKPQVKGDTVEERKASFKNATDKIKRHYVELDESTDEMRAGDYGSFCAIPFGRELFVMVRQELDKLETLSLQVRAESEFG